MRAAVHDGCIVRSPVEVKGASKEPVQEQAIPTVGEVEALASAVPEPYRAMALIAWCGLRFGELVALRRDRVDLLHGKIRVAETVTELGSGDRFTGPPKTTAGRRTVAVPPNIAAIIEARLVPSGQSHQRSYSRPHRVGISAEFISASVCGYPPSKLRVSPTASTTLDILRSRGRPHRGPLLPS